MNLQRIQDSLKGILPPAYYDKIDKIIKENKDQVNIYIQNGDTVGLLIYLKGKMGAQSPSPTKSPSPPLIRPYSLPPPPPPSPTKSPSPSPTKSPSPASSTSWWILIVIFLFLLMGVFAALLMKKRPAVK